MLMDTNPWLLGLTMVVTLLHTVFDILAFKNDIQFWKVCGAGRGWRVKDQVDPHRGCCCPRIAHFAGAECASRLHSPCRVTHHPATLHPVLTTPSPHHRGGGTARQRKSMAFTSLPARSIQIAPKWPRSTAP